MRSGCVSRHSDTPTRIAAVGAIAATRAIRDTVKPSCIAAAASGPSQAESTAFATAGSTSSDACNDARAKPPIIRARASAARWGRQTAVVPVRWRALRRCPMSVTIPRAHMPANRP